MSIRKCDYKVFLYKNDYFAMCHEVFRYQHNETGGSLFGLWTTSGNVVVHVALGPGKKCRRTSTSFHQDIKYLERVGRFLNDKFMLCHIGEWHSHHRLSLDEPSSGDRDTVKRNYPKGMERFLVIIANIVARDEDPVVLSPYFFTNDGSMCEKGEFIVLDADSPFTSNLTIASEIKDGAEDFSSQPVESPVVNGYHSFTRNQHSAREGGPPYEHGNKNYPRTSAADNPRDKSDDDSTRMDINVPPRDYEDGPSSLHTVTRNHSVIQITVPQSNSQDIQIQTRQEIILQKVYQEVQSKFHCSKTEVTIQRDKVSGDIDMKFKHNNRFWLISFPCEFPLKPAKISRSFIENGSYFLVRRAHDPGSLNNHIAILLAIKTECHGYSCSTCRRITAECLLQSDPTLSLFLTEEGNNVLKELWDRATLTIADPGTLEKQLKLVTSRYEEKDPFIEVSFMHYSRTWVVKLSSLFPGRPAKLSCKEESIVGMSEKPVSLRNSVLKLDRVCNILLAISQYCRCEKCQSLKLN